MIPRRVAMLGVAAVLLAGAGIAAAATIEPPGDGPAATPATVVTTTPSTTTEPATTTTTPAPTSTTTPPPAATTTAAPRRPTTTTTRRPATTVAPRPSSTTAAPVPACTPAQIQVTAAASRPSYGPMEDVEVTTVLRNRSATACSYNGYGVEFTFRDAAGEAFAGGSVIADTFAAVPLAPGGSLTHSGPWRHIFQPAGPHTATAVWTFAGHRFEATATFQLT